MPEIYLGALSGTSVDSIDIIATEINEKECKPLSFDSFPIETDLADRLRKIQNELHSLQEFGELDSLFSVAFSDKITQFLKRHSLETGRIKALGLHGQTVLHHPQSPYPFTLQIGDPNTVATRTGITTVSDFRRRDIAYGGQGAPLAPCFHAFAFAKSKQAEAIVNIGGISNVSFLSDCGEVDSGFDSGPGNCLLDAWIRKHKSLPFDEGGAWAQSKAPDQKLLQKLLQDPYFSLPHPKSTCTSAFGLDWLEKHLSDDCDPAVVQSTLAELSAHCIVQSITDNPLAVDRVLVCGGGAYNTDLLNRIAEKSALVTTTTAKEGVDPLHVEALCFAWLAYRRVHKKATEMSKITGAEQAVLLGNVYLA